MNLQRMYWRYNMDHLSQKFLTGITLSKKQSSKLVDLLHLWGVKGLPTKPAQYLLTQVSCLTNTGEISFHISPNPLSTMPLTKECSDAGMNSLGQDGTTKGMIATLQAAHMKELENFTSEVKSMLESLLESEAMSVSFHLSLSGGIAGERSLSISLARTQVKKPGFTAATPN